MHTLWGLFACTDCSVGWSWQFPAVQTQKLPQGQVKATSWLSPLSDAAVGTARWRVVKVKPWLLMCNTFPCTGQSMLQTSMVLWDAWRGCCSLAGWVHSQGEGNTMVPGAGHAQGTKASPVRNRIMILHTRVYRSQIFPWLGQRGWSSSRARCPSQLQVHKP